MRKWKRALAAVMAGVMMVGATGVTALADVTPTKKGWLLEEDGWRYYNQKSDGTFKAVKNVMRYEPSGTYYLKSDGLMASNEMLYLVKDPEGEANNNGKWLDWREWKKIRNNSEFAAAYEEKFGDTLGEEDIQIMFAKPSGKMATKWTMLDPVDDDGTKVTLNPNDEDEMPLDPHMNFEVSYDVDRCCWFYFNQDGALQDRIKTVEDGTYAFYENGVMRRSEWFSDKYFTMHGKMAKDVTYFLTPSDSNAAKAWFDFDESGAATEVKEGDVLENGDTLDKLANYEEINEIRFVVDGESVVQPEPGQPLTLNVGEEAVLKFTIKTPSASNAIPSKYHDVYIERGFEADGNPGMMATGFKVKMRETTTNNSSGRLRLTITPNVPGKAILALYVDDEMIRYEVECVVPENKVNDVTEAMADNVFDGSGDGLDTLRAEELKNFVKEDADTAETKMATLESSWLTNMADVAGMDGNLALSEKIDVKATNVSAEAATLDIAAAEASVAGGTLLAEKSVELAIDKPADTDALVETYSADYENIVPVDIKLNIDGTSQEELDLPVVVTMPLPEGFAAGDVIIHIHEDGTVEEITSDKYTIDTASGTVSFAVSKFSTFVFAQNKTAVEDPVVPPVVDNNSNNDDDNGSASTTTKTETVKDVVTVDDKKGMVSSTNGILTGEGENYSNWNAVVAADGSTSWTFTYADGTMAAGTVEVAADGSTFEQPAWELINGKWFAFGADGVAEDNWIWDTKLGGWFFVDINNGMLTGWQLIGNVWYYLNPVSDGNKGMCFLNRWIDGWYVDASGAWDGKAQVLN